MSTPISFFLSHVNKNKERINGDQPNPTLSMMLSITSSERFMPDPARVATTICFTSCLFIYPCCFRSYSLKETAEVTNEHGNVGYYKKEDQISTTYTQSYPQFEHWDERPKEHEQRLQNLESQYAWYQTSQTPAKLEYECTSRKLR